MSDTLDKEAVKPASNPLGAPVEKTSGAETAAPAPTRTSPSEDRAPEQENVSQPPGDPRAPNEQQPPTKEQY